MTLARARALLIVGSLAALAAAFVIWAILRDSQPRDSASAERQCEEGEKPAATAIPEPKALAVNVYNDTDEAGLAAKIADQLEARGFKVKKVGNDPDPNPVKGTAELRFGPKGLGGAHLLTAYLINADLLPDPERKDGVVDVVLGQQFQQLGSPSEVNDALRTIGDPSPPVGMC